MRGVWIVSLGIVFAPGRQYRNALLNSSPSDKCSGGGHEAISATSPSLAPSCLLRPPSAKASLSSPGLFLHLHILLSSCIPVNLAWERVVPPDLLLIEALDASSLDWITHFNHSTENLRCYPVQGVDWPSTTCIGGRIGLPLAEVHSSMLGIRVVY